jgi:murein DD-endopeptidase MepM/ murein hydrolase activator NlpD
MPFRQRHQHDRLRGYPALPERGRPRLHGVALTRALAIGVALAMPAAAIAAEPVADASPSEQELARDAVATAEVADRLAERQLSQGEDGDAVTVTGGASVPAAPLEESAAELADPGPYHPLDAEPDYGDVEAAFGNARGRPHEGQDIFAPTGTRIVAPTDGIVVDGGSDSGRGNWLSIYNPKADQSYSFFHMNAPAIVAKGEKVDAGTKVGEVGCTGSCYGEHLPFEVREGRGPYGTAIDPMPYLSKWPRIGS